MQNTLNIGNILNGLFALVLVVVGVLNIAFVHPVPGIVYLLLSLVYFPPAMAYLKKSLGFSIPLAVKIILGIAIIMFTLGVSDLGDMIDKM